jgi:hypothetical protein
MRIPISSIKKEMQQMAEPAEIGTLANRCLNSFLSSCVVGAELEIRCLRESAD